MSITSNALLVIGPRSSRRRARRYQNKEPGGWNLTPQGGAFRERRGGELLERLSLQLGNYLNADRDCLHDVLTTDGWGFGSARRALEPGVELIKLVRTGSNDPILITEPRIMQAHLFQLALRGASWVLIGLDAPDPALDQTEW